jgi:hypothetical protein
MYITTNGYQPCAHCGVYHSGRCPQVKAIEYYPNGNIKRIEFIGPGDYLAPLGVPLPPSDPLSPPYRISDFTWIRPGTSTPATTTITSTGSTQVIYNH